MLEYSSWSRVTFLLRNTQNYDMSETSEDFQVLGMKGQIISETQKLHLPSSL